MTKSTITREQLIKKAQEQIEFCRHTKITGEGRAHVNQCAALFEIALAAMDSEPVAEVYQAPNVGICAALGPSIRMLCPLEPGTKLYRHAQPAPASMGDHQIRELVNELRDISIECHGTQQLRERIARTVRAAMLNGGKS